MIFFNCRSVNGVSYTNTTINPVHPPGEHQHFAQLGPSSIFLFDHYVKIRKIDDDNIAEVFGTFDLEPISSSSLRMLAQYWRAYHMINMRPNRNTTDVIDFQDQSINLIIPEAYLQFLFYNKVLWQTVMRVIACGCQEWKPSIPFLHIMMSYYHFHYRDIYWNELSQNLMWIPHTEIICDICHCFYSIIGEGYYANHGIEKYKNSFILIASFIQIFRGHWFVEFFMKMAQSDEQGFNQCKALLSIIYSDEILRAWYHVQHSGFFDFAVSQEESSVERGTTKRLGTRIEACVREAIPPGVLFNKNDWMSFSNAASYVTSWMSAFTRIDDVEAIILFDFNLYGRERYFDPREAQPSPGNYWHSIQFGHDLQVVPKFCYFESQVLITHFDFSQYYIDSTE